jgi:hypothetical protein
LKAYLAMTLITAIVFAAVRIVLLIWASPLSVRYNTWTTGFRERHPKINPPPTPEWRARNTKIMTGMFRLLGGLSLIFSILHFLSLVKT